MGNSWVEIGGKKSFKGYIIVIAADCDQFGHRSAGPKNCPKNSRIAVRIKSDQCPRWTGLPSELLWNTVRIVHEIRHGKSLTPMIDYSLGFLAEFVKPPAMRREGASGGALAAGDAQDAGRDCCAAAQRELDARVELPVRNPPTNDLECQ